MTETVSSAIGIADISETAHREKAEAALNTLTEADKKNLIEASTRGRLQKLRDLVTELNRGTKTVDDYVVELKNTTEELKKDQPTDEGGDVLVPKNPIEHQTQVAPAVAPPVAPVAATPSEAPKPEVVQPVNPAPTSPETPAPTPAVPPVAPVPAPTPPIAPTQAPTPPATPTPAPMPVPSAPSSPTTETPQPEAGPPGPLDMVLSKLTENIKLKESLTKLAAIPFIGGFLLTMFFSKEALKDAGINVADLSLDKVLGELGKDGQIEKNAQEILQKRFEIKKPEDLFLLANEDSSKTPKLSVGEFIDHCPDNFPESSWKRICADLNKRGATSTTSGSVMKFMIEYLKKNNKSWDVKGSNPGTPE